MRSGSPILALLVFTLGGAVPAVAQTAILIRITPQVVELDQTVSWEQPLSKLTRSGSPVVVNIDAEGLSIRVSVTPFTRGGDYLLVVQGDVRQKGPEGFRGSTSLQSLLVPPGEPIAFFPLGRGEPGHARQMVVLIRAEASDE